LRVVDWEHPANNDLLLISQSSVTGALSVTSAFSLQPCSRPGGRRVEEAQRARARGVRRESEALKAGRRHLTPALSPFEAARETLFWLDAPREWRVAMFDC